MLRNLDVREENRGGTRRSKKVDELLRKQDEAEGIVRDHLGLVIPKPEHGEKKELEDEEKEPEDDKKRGPVYPHHPLDKSDAPDIKCSSRGDTPLLIGCFHGSLEVVHLLALERGADPNFHSSSDGATALMRCVEGQHLACMRMLMIRHAPGGLQHLRMALQPRSSHHN
jgi:hypothetical protein